MVDELTLQVHLIVLQLEEVELVRKPFSLQVPLHALVQEEGLEKVLEHSDGRELVAIECEILVVELAELKFDFCFVGALLD